LFKKEQWSEAMNAFNQALKINEEDASAYYGIGLIYAGRGKRTLAMEHYTKALKYERDADKKNAIMSQLFKSGGTWDV